ncbi:MAG: SpoIIE family protein phosphatase [Planctomycetes bacterium]|nr:SpoIIE family protein phosphatase [Planctomycetota bacterium]
MNEGNDVTAFLMARNGPARGQRYVLNDESVLGRQPGCDVLIDVGAVSRRHAKVVREGDDFYVEDLQSRNGTFLNDQKIEFRRLLAHGDQIRVCDVEFDFQFDPPPEKSGRQTDSVAAEGLLEGSNCSTFLVDDAEESANSSSTIMSKVDVTSTARGIQVTATAEARLKALIEITQSMGGSVGLDDVLPRVLNSLFKIFLQADRGFIVLETPEGETIRISRTIVRQTMETKEAILSADAASDSRFEMSQSIADFRIRSMMCAPLVTGEGKAFGALQIDTVDQRSRFTKEDLEVLAGVAAQAAIAIENAQLHEQAVSRKELERDLDLARQVQHGFLPQVRPKFEGYSFYNYYKAANHIGGDYFDYVHLPDGRLAIVVADVVGHGVAAALLMAKLASEMRFSLAAHGEPGRALTSLNDHFSQLELEERFVTLVMCVLDPAKHEVTMVSAGHMPPLIRGPNGEIREEGDEAVGLPLGIVEGMDYDEAHFSVQPGETLILYTDGINEAMDPDDDEYTIPRLKEMLAKPADSIEALGEALVADVRRHIGARAQYDDMCVVAFGRV